MLIRPLTNDEKWWKLDDPLVVMLIAPDNNRAAGSRSHHFNYRFSGLE